MKSNQIREKEVSDLNYAAILIFRGYKLLNVQWVDRKAFWVFNDEDNDADDAIRSFINDEITGSLKRFVGAQNIIRQTLYSKN